MTTKYTEEFKASIIARLLPPNNASVPEVSKETGIPKDTLYYWRYKYGGTQGSKAIESGRPGQFSAEEKLAVVIETASRPKWSWENTAGARGFIPSRSPAGRAQSCRA